MIRDEFKNADKKVISQKSNSKIKKMGERAYYAKRMTTMSEIIKPINFSSIFSTICFLIMAVLYLLPIFLKTEDYVLPTLGYIVTVVAGILLVWSIVWFAFLAPYCKRRAEFYKSELARMNREYVSKNVGKR